MKKFFRQLGPGLITAALVFGPGSLTVTTKLGAGFGNAMLWVIPLAMIFMIGYTNMSARIGLNIQQSIMDLIRARYGKPMAILLGLGIFGITISFQAGNSIGAGLAFAELSGTPTPPWIVFFSVLAILLLFFKSFYKILEKLMMGLVLIMFASFFMTLILSRPDWGTVLAGFVPHVPQGSEILSIALFASSFSVVAAFYQSYLVQEKGWAQTDTTIATAESRNGILILGTLSGMVMMCAAAVLFGKSIAVNTPSDLGLALEPLFGKLTTIVFMIGFFAASFSSLIGNATIGGAILADAFGYGKRLSSWKVRGVIIAIIVVGAGVSIQFGALPLQLIIFAQALTIIIAPAAAITLLWLANDKKAMGNTANTWQRNIIPILGLVILLFLAGYNINTIFF